MRVVLLLSLSLIYLTAIGQEITVLDLEKKPLSQVSIKAYSEKLEFSIFTNKNGKANIPQSFKKSKKLAYIVSKYNYSTIERNIRITKDTTIYISLISLDEVVITAQMKNKNASEAIQDIQVLNKKTIEKKGAISLKDILEKQVNMRLSQDNILGSSLSMQGISGQNIKILIDDVPVLGRLNGNIDISQINLNNIERIEIVEGPLSVNYGTDALGGTINLISKKETETSLNINSYYESVGKYNLDGFLNYKLKQQNLSVSLGRNYFDGWSPEDEWIFFPQATLADSSRYKIWKPKEQLFFKGQHVFKNKNLSLYSFYNQFYEQIQNRGLPRSPYLETAFDDYYRTWRKDFGSSLNFNINDKSNIKLLIANNNYKRIKSTYFKDLTTLEQMLTLNESDQDTSYFNLLLSRGSYAKEMSRQIKIEIGYDIQKESAQGKRIEESEKSRIDIAVYSNLEVLINDRLIARPGLRFAYNTDYKVPLIPSIHLKYSSGEYVFRGSIAKGFRAPSLKELYFEFQDVNHNILGNKDLNAETSKNYHFSISRKKSKLNSVLTYKASVFYNDLESLITLAENNDVYTYINVNQYRTKGIKGGMGWSDGKIDLEVGASYIGRYNSLSETENLDKYIFSQEYSASLTFNLNTEQNSTLSVFYKYTGEIPSFTLNENGLVEDSFTQEYELMDIIFSRNLFNNLFKVSVGCKNIFDVQDISSFQENEPHQSGGSAKMSIGYGRSLFTAIKLNIK